MSGLIPGKLDQLAFISLDILIIAARLHLQDKQRRALDNFETFQFVTKCLFVQVSNPLSAVCNNDDYNRSTRLLAATTLRNVLGTRNLSEILSDREAIADTMHHGLEEATNPWGVHVDRVEIKDVRLPVELQRVMAAEAEAAREARAKVIAAEGEQKSSGALKVAAEVIQQSPHALQLRYLQTLTAISTEQNSTIIFPMPISVSNFA